MPYLSYYFLFLNKKGKFSNMLKIIFLKVNIPKLKHRSNKNSITSGRLICLVKLVVYCNYYTKCFYFYAKNR